MVSDKINPDSKVQSTQGWRQIIEHLKTWPWKAMGIRVGKILCIITVVIFTLYLWGMIFYNGPFQQAGLWNTLLACVWAGLVVYLCRWKIGWKKRVPAVALAAMIVVLPYSFIQPSNDREWTQDVKEYGHSVVEGDRVTIHNVRNFDYTEDGEVMERWEIRTVHLSNLRGLDLYHDTFMGDVMGHPILSFDFGPDGRVCLSVETRKEQGESFSPVVGLYKILELYYLFSTEEDCIRVRTNIKKEPVYLYQIDSPISEIREMFMTSVNVQNELNRHPRFYNVISANCTTSLRSQRPTDKRGDWDNRILFNGLLDEYLYEQNRLKTYGLSFDELRQRSLINEAAEKAHCVADFSKKIREGRPN